jgi:glycerol-3-phosphate acyltransferase PlsX
MKIAIDIMGGDHAPKATVQGAIEAGKELDGSVELVLIGDEDTVKSELEEAGEDPGSYHIIHASEVITMDDNPTRSLNQKKDSSIAKGFGALQQKEVDAFAGVGNTGAMLVGSMYSVKVVKGVIRPTITSIIPKEDGGFGVILDVGANADCKADVLYQFGIMGSLYAQHVYGIQDPRVALLNIGEEDKKGSLLTQQAHGMMKGSKDFNFIGNVEGRDIFSDKCDVIVCDGFTGNVVLKEAEAFYEMIRRKGFQDPYFDRFNYESYGGTPVLGVDSNVVIGHGISNANAIKNMLIHTTDVVKAELPERFKKAFG